MAIKSRKTNIPVSVMAEQRIRNVFSNGVKVYMSVSGGKDSIVLFDLVYHLAETGQIDKDLLTVQFIDEEAIFPEVEETVIEMRQKCLMLGIEFNWYCMEFKHFNCFNALENDESFITFDRYKEDVWVRQPPKFAIRNHHLLTPRTDSYQDFLTKLNKDGILMTGVRASESIQRRQNIAPSVNKTVLNNSQAVWPIYDYKDSDIWLHILRRGLTYPKTYAHLYQVGRPRNEMRLSQLFSIDTAKILVEIQEFYPDLYEAILKREPNAYLASLYWDTEMFRRSKASKNRKKKEANEKAVEDTEDLDYDVAIMQMYHNFDREFTTKNQRRWARQYFIFYLQYFQYLDDGLKRTIYNALVGGDPKGRTYRGMMTAFGAKKGEQAHKEYGKEYRA